MAFEPRTAVLLRQELEIAQTELNKHLAVKVDNDMEIDRYQQVVLQLNETIKLIEAPATSVKRRSVMPVAPVQKEGRRWSWWSEIENALKLLAENNVHPTRKELMDTVFSRNPTGSFGSITAAVYNAVNSGKIVWKGDKCYLPGTEPKEKLN